ncbi:MAG: hypothetical protein NZM00_06535, partial [Anaerolinea sp.]|nr:hypothetical protein [Anaerolinea sp.]
VERFGGAAAHAPPLISAKDECWLRERERANARRADQDLCYLRPSIHLAQEMGARLGALEILL